MPLSRSVSLRKRSVVLCWDPSHCVWGEGHWHDKCDLQYVYSDLLIGEARAGLRCNNGKPTFQKALTYFMEKLLLFDVGAFILKKKAIMKQMELMFSFLRFMIINKKCFIQYWIYFLYGMICLILFCWMEMLQNDTYKLVVNLIELLNAATFFAVHTKSSLCYSL